MHRFGSKKRHINELNFGKSQKKQYLEEFFGFFLKSAFFRKIPLHHCYPKTLTSRKISEKSCEPFSRKTYNQPTDKLIY